MRVISPHPGYELQVFEGKDARMTDHVTGQAYTVVERPSLNAVFMSGAEGAGLFPHELQAALAAWDGIYRGKPDEVRANPAPYISVYDTEAQKIALDWTDEYHKAVCDRIRFLAPDRGDRMLIIEDLKAPKPFPAYDSKTPEEILAFMEWSEGDPSLYLTYETDNEARPELLEAIALAADKYNSEDVVASVTA